MEQRDRGILDSLDPETIAMGHPLVTPFIEEAQVTQTVLVPLPSGGKVWITYQSVRGSRQGRCVCVWVPISAELSTRR